MKTIISILSLLIIGQSLQPQDLNGTILDSSNIPVSDALVYSGEKHGHSDLAGKFILKNISVGDTIYINYLGYENLERIISKEDLETEITLKLTVQQFELSQVNITNSVKSANVIADIDLKIDPVNSSQEILMRMPGLLIGQHAGGGKAEQIFLRGFDIDHGTDISINVDGMPVNMVSHAHGQGYSDLHFVIPETIDEIDFGKGPYYTDVGNFNTAGYVEFKTRDRLSGSSIGLEFGDFNTGRLIGLFDLLGDSEDQNAYIATEYQQTDGPVESPQNFNRLNLMAKYNQKLKGGDKLSFIVSRFQSKWDASGQIPQRLVDNGTITRFGSVDDTEGGSTSRTNFAVNHSRLINSQSLLKTNVFYSQYAFELFSNFTFFLEDPTNGDQIRQNENRNIFGLNSTLFNYTSLGNSELEMSYGLGLRYDDINNNELSRTFNRKTTLENLSLGEVDETNLNLFVNGELDLGDWLINAGIRLDYFNFNYNNQLSPLYDNRSEEKTLLSPKLNFIYNPNSRWQIYLKSGLGFHSNDSRVVIDQSSEVVLPAAFGSDLGFIWKPFDNLWLNAAAWYLFLEQEFVYVGDAGIVEPSGETRRQGIDFSIRYQFGKNIFFNSDVTYTFARAIEEEKGNDYIPLAVDLMASGGLTFKDIHGFSGGIQYRYIKDRPANEDNSIIALGYFITDLNLNYDFKKTTVGISVQNLFDVDWNEAQFATESRLSNEVNSIEELHFTPGVPLFLKGNIKYSF